ncbi:MAG: hypothetical protein ABR499_21470 [Gemmatimonadaceae bacterium]
MQADAHPRDDGERHRSRVHPLHLDNAAGAGRYERDRVDGAGPGAIAPSAVRAARTATLSVSPRTATTRPSTSVTSRSRKVSRPVIATSSGR